MKIYVSGEDYLEAVLVEPGWKCYTLHDFQEYWRIL